MQSRQALRREELLEVRVNRERTAKLEPLQQNLWVPRRRDSPRILTSNKLYPILMGIKVVATSQLPIQTSDLRGQRLRRGCPW